MTGPRSTYVQAGGFEVHVTEWGAPGKPALIMWHGLARTGRDFDEVAQALSDNFFVLCPDTIGRGLSAWARDPVEDYSYRSFGAITLDLLDHYSIDNLRWLGTSMGGLLGVTLAADLLKGRITHLVINDVGPNIPRSGIERIADYIGNPPVYDSVAELEAWLRRNYAPFGQNSDAFWRRMGDTSARRTDDGRVTVHYDPKIATQLTHNKGDLDIWELYDKVEARTLLLRGKTSDVLSPSVADEMTLRGPRPQLHVIEGCGHAPTLTGSTEIAVLRAFFSS
jgi:pimeloyl-ACP methyl ester carboxylesterase